jgi:Spy/CpxP family protein refolding chaperone
MGFARKLNLTDAQKEQWKAVEQNFRQENASFFEQSKQTREALHAAKKAGDTGQLESLKATAKAQHAQMKQLRAAMEPKLMAILNADQQAQFQTMKAERAGRGDGQGEGHEHQKQEELPQSLLMTREAETPPIFCMALRSHLVTPKVYVMETRSHVRKRVGVDDRYV